jgi:excisionase family DNA binding protein
VTRCVIGLGLGEYALVCRRGLTVRQVADLLGLHIKTVRGYVRDGRLKATRIGTSYRITRTDLAAFTGGPVGASARETRQTAAAGRRIQRCPARRGEPRTDEPTQHADHSSRVMIADGSSVGDAPFLDVARTTPAYARTR